MMKAGPSFAALAAACIASNAFAALLAQRFRELACLLDWQINCEAALEAVLPDDQRLL